MPILAIIFMQSCHWSCHNVALQSREIATAVTHKSCIITLERYSEHLPYITTASSHSFDWIVSVGTRTSYHGRCSMHSSSVKRYQEFHLPRFQWHQKWVKGTRMTSENENGCWGFENMKMEWDLYVSYSMYEPYVSDIIDKDESSRITITTCSYPLYRARSSTSLPSH